MRLHEAVLDEIFDEPVCSSRGRRNHRGVKQKMSNFPIRPRAPINPKRITVENHIKVLK